MITFTLSMKILIISTIPHVDSFIYILSSMWMYNINDYLNSMFMSFIYQSLKLIWFSKAWRDTKKRRDMVSKWAIIRMFHNTHNLYDIVSKFDHFREYCLLEMCEAMDFIIHSTHSDMAFIDFDIFVFPCRFRVFPLIFA